VLLEPVMRVEVVVPKDYIDDVLVDLSSRRGEVQSQQERGGRQIVSARVPLSGMFGYAADLRSKTHGFGTCSICFDRYQEVISPPPDDNVAVREPRDRGPRGRSSAAAVPEPEPEQRTRATGGNILPSPSPSGD
jgi:translation elongation factor EF-G